MNHKKWISIVIVLSLLDATENRRQILISHFSTVFVLGMNVQQACEAPRWQHMSERGLLGYDETVDGVLELESRFNPVVLEQLKSKGHKIRDLGPWGKYYVCTFIEVYLYICYEVITILFVIVLAILFNFIPYTIFEILCCVFYDQYFIDLFEHHHICHSSAIH